MQNYKLLAKYRSRQVVKDRNGAALVKWSAYETAQAIPTSPPPDDEWVRLRIFAEQIPVTTDAMVSNTLSFFWQDPTTIANITQFISEDNDDTTEDQLATDSDAIMSGFAQRYADTMISQAQVDNWRTQHNLPPSPTKGQMR